MNEKMFCKCGILDFLGGYPDFKVASIPLADTAEKFTFEALLSIGQPIGSSRYSRKPIPVIGFHRQLVTYRDA